MPEFYVNGELRWSLWFDNPNKAGAFLAALLPFAWWLLVNRWDNAVARNASRLVGLVSGVAGIYAAVHTHSRGAMVAIAAAGMYLSWRYRERWKRWILPGAIALGLFCLAAGIIVFSQRRTAITSDGSVTNRFDLWKGALQVFSSAPNGVGAGNSGAIYMDWFQPVDRSEKYRTMVNSYLTFLVEFGWLYSAAAMFCFFYFWFATCHARSNLSNAARASVIATLVAGFFSTTLENWHLWIAAGVSALILIGTSTKILTDFKKCFFWSTALSCAVILFCVGIGKWNQTDPRIRMSASGDVKVSPVGSDRAMDLLPDSVVLGDSWPKLVRELSLALKSEIQVNGTGGKVIVAAGDQVRNVIDRPSSRVVLIAPVRLEEETLERLLRGSQSFVVLNPSFDEDGRARFWRNVAAEFPDKVWVQILSGVGNDVACAWEQVIDAIRQADSK